MRRLVVFSCLALMLLVGCATTTPNQASAPTSAAAPSPSEPATASVQLSLKEVAVEPKAISGATVRIDGLTATRGPDGTFSAADLPAGAATVAVSAKGHETTTTSITLVPGENTPTVRLTLTVAETYQRYFKAYKFGRFGVAYKYVHPDCRKRYSLKKFTRDMKITVAISLQLGDQRVLRKWKSKFTKRTYTNITEIDRTYVYELFGRRLHDNLSQHWAKVGGLWYVVFAS